MTTAVMSEAQLTGRGAKPTLAEECRDLRFKLKAANRRLAELGQVTSVPFSDLQEAFELQCELLGTTTLEVRRSLRRCSASSTRDKCIRGVHDRCPDATVMDLSRFFGCDRHVIYRALRDRSGS